MVDGDHRSNIFEFFRSHTAFDLLPESGKVCLLDSSLSAFAALSIMSANQQTAVPVWNSRDDSYMGMLTVTDLVEIVLACRNSKMYSSCLEGLKAMTIEHWMCHNARPHGSPLPSIEVHPDDDLLQVLWTLVRNNCRVVPVLERDGSKKDTAMLSQCLVGQVSYFLLFRFLFYHQASELNRLEGNLTELGIGTIGPDRVVCVRSSEPVAKALEAMSKHGISGVPVVDEGGSLVGLFSDVDILCFTPDMLSMDLKSALSVAAVAGDKCAVAWGEGGTERGESAGRPVAACRTDDPLRSVVAKFSLSGSARLACTDADGRVEGIVTLTDLFKFMAGSSR
eukprot:CAMPEP_0113686086 /NCGR_PEP_ID=MMETSP0038_2-20120614/15080_1 /TAXON_ID=2898 /ORGANISM="Cryptomonas paramecium" /LENGTH=336 /DNA_ID=CAMNT_0000606341 /DNA_START=139 /DNA_END=1149 /DNA_ORIENTATION=- /assembly_acc=CAM_ASM_000170